MNAEIDTRYIVDYLKRNTYFKVEDYLKKNYNIKRHKMSLIVMSARLSRPHFFSAVEDPGRGGGLRSSSPS